VAGAQLGPRLIGPELIAANAALDETPLAPFILGATAAITFLPMLFGGGEEEKVLPPQFTSSTQYHEVHDNTGLSRFDPGYRA